ncbi:MAG: hypothetical protein ABIS50_09620 [Luteolibacter sp.]|uniref:DUF6916 family protein n=1 Tax=Luteolibacter sp. TaxID=1962973 RepID=UPI00326753F3
MSNSSDFNPSSLTRRRILGWGGAGAIGGLAGYLGLQPHESKNITPGKTAQTEPQLAAPGDSSQIEAASQNNTVPQAGVIRREDFLPHLKSLFRLESINTNCTLVEVGEAQKQVSPTAEFTSFSLLFTALKGSIIESKIHQLAHGKMGTFDLFISPVGESNERVYLEAVCSHRV